MHVLVDFHCFRFCWKTIWFFLPNLVTNSFVIGNFSWAKRLIHLDINCFKQSRSDIEWLCSLLISKVEKKPCGSFKTVLFFLWELRCSLSMKAWLQFFLYFFYQLHVLYSKTNLSKCFSSRVFVLYLTDPLVRNTIYNQMSKYQPEICSTDSVAL